MRKTRKNRLKYFKKLPYEDRVKHFQAYREVLAEIETLIKIEEAFYDVKNPEIKYLGAKFNKRELDKEVKVLIKMVEDLTAENLMVVIKEIIEEEGSLHAGME